MNKKRLFILKQALALFMVLCSVWGWGQTIQAGASYAQNFDGIGTAANATLPSGWKIDNVTGVRTVTKAYSAVSTNQTANALTYNTAMSNSAANGRWNFGGSTSTDRAVGGISSGSASQSVNTYLELTNNGATSISDFVISYDAERYRNGTNTAGSSIRFYYSTTGLADSWTEIPAGIASFAGGQANNNGSTTNPMQTISVQDVALNQPLAANGTIYFAWSYSVTTGSTTSNVQALGIDNVLINANSSTTPVITAAASSLTTFTYVEGSGPSAIQSFTVSGSNLTDNITVSAPTGFEVSKTTSTGFADNLSFTQTAGNVATTPVYVRMKENLPPASYSGNISLASTNATTVNIALSGTVTPMPVKPVISAPPAQAGTVGVAFTYQIVASENPTAFAVASGTLPAGLSLSTTSGLISGTPTAAGTFSVNVTASNAAGTSDPAAIEFTIAKGTQTATLNDINATVGSAPITLPETTSAGLPITYNTSNSAVAGLSGNTLSVGNAGTAVITAANNGNANYEGFSRTFTVSVTEGPPPFTFIENFDYTNGQLVGQGNWNVTSTNATPVVNVTSPTISFPGYLSSGIGNEVSLIGSGQDVNKLFASQEAGSIYASFLVNVSDAKSGGDYFFNLGPNPIGTNYRGRVFVRSSGAGIQFGVSNAGTAQYNSTVYDLNTTYLIVLKYDINSSSPNAAKIYINPTLNAIEPTTGWTASNDSSSQPSIGAVALRQGASSSAPTLRIDGIRVADRWENIVGLPVITWNGTAWSNTTGPDATTPAIIDADYSGAAFTAKSLTVNAGKTLTVAHYVSTGDVTNNGNILVADGGNFVQTGTFTAGADSSFKVRKDTKPVKRLAYVNWSSPMAGSAQTLKQFSYGKNADGTNQSATGTVDNRFFTYNNNTFVSVLPGSTFNPAGAGFLIRTPNDFTTAAQVFHGQFEGTIPNSGTINYDHSLISGDYVMLGNPYPSAISIDDFLLANPGTQETFYIWNSEAEMVDNQYGGGNYNTYAPNTGSVPAGAINGYIAVGQGFFIERGTVTTPFVFNNGMRQTSQDGVFSKAATADKFWLELTAPSGSKPQMLIGFNAAASTGFDTGYDAALIGSNSEAIYSEVNGRKLVIDSHGAFNSDDTFALKADMSTAGSYTIGVLKTEGIFSNGQQIWLKDQITGATALISEQPYTFSADAGTLANRFTLQFKPGGALATGSATKADIQIYSAGSDVHAVAAERITSLNVFDMSGRLIAKAPVAQKEIVLNVAYKGVVLVKVQLANGTVKTTKLMLK